MNLLIDIGNTSAKYAVTQGEEMLLSERLSGPWLQTLQRLLTQYTIDRIVVSCVGQKAELVETLDRLGLSAMWIGHATPSAITGVPEGYGADRLAADVGAYRGQHALLVIDAGTCITYDLIVDGRLAGGVISPGVQLRLNAMHDYTALLPAIDARGCDKADSSVLMANDTQGCMLSAALHGPQYEMEGYIRALRRDYPDLEVVLTGGNAFLPDVDGPCTYDPLLVLKGLCKFAS